MALNSFAFHIDTLSGLCFQPPATDNPGKWSFYRFGLADSYKVAICVQIHTPAETFKLSAFKCIPFREIKDHYLD